MRQDTRSNLTSLCIFLAIAGILAGIYACTGPERPKPSAQAPKVQTAQQPRTKIYPAPTPPTQVQIDSSWAYSNSERGEHRYPDGTKTTNE